MKKNYKTRLELENLAISFKSDDENVLAVNNVNLKVPESKTLCIVGESGCGKSVTASSILKLHDPKSTLIEGKINYYDSNGRKYPIHDMESRGTGMQEIRGNEISMIFQEPMTALSPVHTVGNQITEMIRLHEKVNKKIARDKTINLLDRVGIPSPEKRIDLYPFQLSGGMRQRVMIAMALCCQPDILIADEPTTALDVTTQSQILLLLDQLQKEFGMTIILITHDLGVVGEIADYVVVMYLGEMVEFGDVYTIFENPSHPYTKDLLASIPTINMPWNERLKPIEGTVPTLMNRPKGCAYHPRCKNTMEICRTEYPNIKSLGTKSHDVSCWLMDEKFKDLKN